LIAVAAIGIATLASVASTSDKTTSDWHKPWFLFVIGVFIVLALAGLYVVFAGAIPWLPPTSWTTTDRRTSTFTGSGQVSALEVNSTADSVTEGSLRALFGRVFHRPASEARNVGGDSNNDR
jgi:hypothetical protein